MRAAVAFGVGLALTTTSAVALAFSTLETFGARAIEGGGSGIYFTGSPRFRGYDCTLCHVGAPGLVEVALDSDPPELFVEQRYRPWQEYVLGVRLGEQRGGDGDHNTFVAEIVDDGAVPAGTWPQPDTLQVVAGAHVVDGVVSGLDNLTAWTFRWTAPGPGSGRLTLHLGAVDGDGGLSQPEPRPPTDPFGDDVQVVRMHLCELWQPCDLEFAEPGDADSFASPAGYGCAVAPARGPVTPWLAAAAIGLARGRRRRAALAALAILGAGCFDPVLPSECAFGVCAEPPAADTGSPAATEGAGAGGAADTGGMAGVGGSGGRGGTGGIGGAGGSSSSGPTLPAPCACDGCMSNNECTLACDPPPGVYACFYPEEGGCWLVAMPCS
jgi:hypothetical protein